MSLAARVRSGSMWAFLVRIVAQLLSFVSVVVVARRLTPDDYGLIGIVAVALMAFDVISRTGFDTALMQKPPGSLDGYFPTTWTIEVTRGVLQSILLFAAAGVVAHLYERSELIPLIQVIAVVPLIQGFRSVAIVELYRHLDFRKVALFETVPALVGTVTTIILVFIRRDVWSLAFGMIANAIAATLLSYVVAPHRPRFGFDVEKARELWGFGKWELGSSILFVAFHNGDDLLIGKLLGLEPLGYYRMAYRVSNMATTEGVEAVRKVLFPAFAMIQTDIARMRRVFLDFWQVVGMLGLGFGVTLFETAPYLTRVVLGAKWMPIVPALQVLAVWGALEVLKTAVSPVFRAVNRPDWWTKTLAVRVIATAILIYPLSKTWGITGAAVAVLAGALVNLPMTIGWVAQAIECRTSDLLRPLGISFLAAFVAWPAGRMTAISLSSASDLVRLIVVAGVCVVAFTATILLADQLMKTGIRAKLRHAWRA